MPLCNPCPDCDGPAIDFGFGAGDGKCSYCHGTGSDCVPHLWYGQIHDCYNCDGTGKCPTCDGKGYLDDYFSGSERESDVDEPQDEPKESGTYSYSGGGDYSGGASSISSSSSSWICGGVLCLTVLFGFFKYLSTPKFSNSRINSDLANVTREVCPGDELRFNTGEEITFRFGDRPGCSVIKFNLVAGKVLRRWIYSNGRVDEGIWASNDPEFNLPERPAAVYLRALEPSVFMLPQQHQEQHQEVQQLVRNELCPGSEVRIEPGEEFLFDIGNQASCSVLFVQLEMGEVLAHWYYSGTPQDPPSEAELAVWKASDRTFKHPERPVALYMKPTRSSVLKARAEDSITQWYTAITPGWHQIEPGEVVWIFDSENNGPRFVPYSNRAFWEARR